MRHIRHHQSTARPTGTGIARTALRGTTVVLVALGLVLGLSGLGSPGYAATGVQARAIATSYDDQVLQLTNVERHRRGLPALRAATCVDRYATSWTRYMAVNDSFRHQALRPILRRCHQRTAGENIARARPNLSPAQVVSMWMHSAGHRANILNRRFRYLGTDAWRSADSNYIYVTQDFSG